MANVHIVKVPVAKGFSSHPGHGSASKTVNSYQAAANKERQILFPAAHPAKGRGV